MAWVSPRTWTTAELVTAAMLNTHLRDNILETAPAKVTTAGDLVYGSGANALARLGVGSAGAALRVNTGATAPQWVVPPAVRVFHNTFHTISTGGSFTGIAFNSEDFDNASMHDTVTNNSRLIAPIVGKYLAYANLVPEGGGTWTIYLAVNGAGTSVSNAFTGGNYNRATADTVVLVGLIDLNANDYIEVMVSQLSGSNKVLSAVSGTRVVASVFGMAWVAP